MEGFVLAEDFSCTLQEGSRLEVIMLISSRWPSFNSGSFSSLSICRSSINLDRADLSLADSATELQGGLLHSVADSPFRLFLDKDLPLRTSSRPICIPSVFSEKLGVVHAGVLHTISITKSSNFCLSSEFSGSSGALGSEDV